MNAPADFVPEPVTVGWSLELSDWECELFGMGRTIVIRPPKGHEPCWFNRLMQRWFFGCKWVKVKKWAGPRDDGIRTERATKRDDGDGRERASASDDGSIKEANLTPAER